MVTFPAQEVTCIMINIQILIPTITQLQENRNTVYYNRLYTATLAAPARTINNTVRWAVYDVYGGPQVPTFVQISGIRHRHHNTISVKCSAASHHETSSVRTTDGLTRQTNASV